MLTGIRATIGFEIVRVFGDNGNAGPDPPVDVDGLNNLAGLDSPNEAECSLLVVAGSSS